MKKIISTLLIQLFLAIISLQSVIAQTIVTPWRWKITSDYGPRVVDKGSPFHKGIDYGGTEGEEIPSVEGGSIEEIAYREGWYIAVTGDHGLWAYVHIFSGNNGNHELPVSSGNWELREVTLMDPVTGKEDDSTCIILWIDFVGKKAAKVLCKKLLAGRMVIVQGYTVTDEDGNDLRSQGSIDPWEPVAPVGTSGGDNGFAAHLHLGLNSREDNPLYYLIHTPDSLPKVKIETPEDNHIFTEEELGRDYAISVDIDSSGGPDLEQVNIWVYPNNDESQAIRLGEYPTFGYGGRDGMMENVTASASTQSDGTNTGIQPYKVNNDSLGHDKFIFSQNFNSLNLPGGEHSLVVRASDVNGYSAADIVHHFTIHNYPTVESTSPENQSYNVATDSKITITFDSEMDTASVESAITISPDFSKTFSWSSDKKTVTITPSWSLSDSADYTVFVEDAAKSAAGDQLDGDDDGNAGGQFQFMFSTKKPVIKITSISHDHDDGTTKWVRAGTKTVTVETKDAYGTTLPVMVPPLLKWTPQGGNTTEIPLSALSSSSFAGTMNITTGNDGPASFSSENTGIYGITSFMIDTTPPSIDPKTIRPINCNCPKGPAAKYYEVTEKGSGIKDTSSIGVGLYFNNCYDSETKITYGAIVEDYVGNTSSLSGTDYASTECDNADENYSVSGSVTPDMIVAADYPQYVNILRVGRYNEFSLLMLDKLSMGNSYVKYDEVSTIASDSSKPLVIPSGGLSYLQNSEIFRVALAEYVKNGGTAIVMSQQNGYDYAALPTTDGNPITAYGWREDQSCQNSSSYIDTYHQVLASISRSTPSINVDGYFISYPADSTVLLRRTANGQPAAIKYQYGNGYIIATDFYSDFGYGTSQASSEEIALIRDILTWARKPVELPEIKPGETVALSLELINETTSYASSAKILIYDPDRKTVLSEQTISTDIDPGYSTLLDTRYAAPSTAILGIYHIDYILYDSSGNIIQPQAETDSGRFVVSNPPTTGTPDKDIWFTITSSSQEVMFGSSFDYTFHIYNNTNETRNLKIKTLLPHTNRTHEWDVTASANGETMLSGSDLFIDTRYYTETLRAKLYDENNVEIGSYMLSFRKKYPSVTTTVVTDKAQYKKGDTVNLSANLQNKESSAYAATVNVRVTDSSNTLVYSSSVDVGLAASGSSAQTTGFTLSSAAQGGSYTVLVEVYDANGNKIGGNTTSFELPLSRISTVPIIPDVLTTGSNTILISLSNIGEVAVSNGALDISLKDPDGLTISSRSQSFTLNINENKTFDINPSIPSIKFGKYALAITESDETKTGSAASHSIENTPEIGMTFDSSSYRIKETANLAVSITNDGKFNNEGATLSVALPDAGFTDIRTVNLGAGQALPLQHTITLPATMTAGQHDATVTLTLPSGSSVVQTTKLTVPQSSLTLDMIGTANPSAGDTITLTIENTGGVDTSYTTEKLTIVDNKGVTIYEGAVSGSVTAGGKQTLAEIKLPSQTGSGPTYLTARIKNDKSGETVSLYKSLEIVGLAAELQTKTEKDIHQSADVITGLSDIANGSVVIENGSLILGVSKVETAYTGAFVKYLPEKEWNPLSPSTASVGEDGSVYVADAANHRIQKFDANGNFIVKWGSYGTSDGQFNYPTGIATAHDGSVYVAENGNNRIQKFDANGNFILKWGSYGSGNNQFYQNINIAVAADGSVYVASGLEDEGGSIKKFDSNGNFISKWTSWYKGDQPSGIAVASDGYIYVADRYNRRVRKFDSNGKFIANWSSWGSNDGQFNYPSGITVASDGSVYVVEAKENGYGDDRVLKFDSSGNFITKWGSSCIVYIEDANGAIIPGNECTGQFNVPHGIAAAPDGSVYVADSYNNRIQKFDNNGNFLIKWGNKGSGEGEFYLPYDITVDYDGSMYLTENYGNSVQKFDKNGNFFKKWGSYCQADANFDGTPEKSCDGQFFTPADISIGYDGYLYVSDNSNHRIQKFDKDGNFIAKWGSYGTGSGQFRYPSGIAIGVDGSIYVADSSNNRIQKFDKDGNFVAKWGSYGTGNGQFKYPGGIAIGGDGSVFVADSSNNRIQKFDSNGALIAKWGSYGTGDGQFKSPAYIAVTSDGSVYVTDGSNNRIQKFDSDGKFISKWGSYGTADGQFNSPKGISVGTDGSIYAADNKNNRIQKMSVSSGGTETLFETSIPVTQSANTTQVYTTDIGPLNATGKLYLTAELRNSLGQTIAESEYPFYIIEGNTALLFNTDKKIYKPGETVTITGEVRNLATVEAANLESEVRSQKSGETAQSLYNETFSVPAGGSYPFTFTTTAGSDGTVPLTGTVSQNGSTLVEITDQYEVASPQASMTVTAPEVVGRETFEMTVEVKNTGKVDTALELEVSRGGVTPPVQEVIDNQTFTIRAGETKMLQYAQQIAATTNYTFTLTGDVSQTATKMVTYGEAATITFDCGMQSADCGMKPESKIGIPVTITNTGQVDSQLEINFQLSQESVVKSQETRTYYIPKSNIVTDTLYYDLTKGSYELSAASAQPAASAQASFNVLKENDVAMTATKGETGSDGTFALSAEITNNGYNDINGSVMVSLVDTTGEAAWSGEQAITQLSTNNSQQITFSINTSAVAAGSYTLKTVLYDSAYQQLAMQSAEFEVRSAEFSITQLPSYQTFTAGSEGTMSFKIKNTGSQEGEMSFALTVMDVLDQTLTEWIKPGEEKELSFAFQLADDLEEKDYFAAYSLTPTLSQGEREELNGNVKFHVAGINIDVEATLDKESYADGETAKLNLTVGRGGVTPPGQGDLNLFARVNYNGYEEQKSFTLTSSSTLTFDVPLTEITGEKLFFGIYAESGRSIHLNSIYIYETGDTINITTDKQVYEPGETVAATIESTGGTPVSGTMTLTGPGDYSESFAFTGSAAKSITLQSVMTAGTYQISYEMTDAGGQTYSGSHPIDVSGIQVKVKEATLDKAKYAAMDTMNLSLNIESNTDMAATLKTWVVDPNGKYTEAGEEAITLTSSTPLLLTSDSSLLTEVMGIHRLVYGIYADGQQGQPHGAAPTAPTELLLSSGSEAFDVGDAVLLGITTDKADYSTITETVNVSISMYGSATATLDIYVDGETVKTETIELGGFETKTVNLEPSAFSPGSHTVKVVLTAGGLTSVKESGIIYGSDLPDLTISVGAYSNTPAVSGNMKITATVINQGNTASTATDVAFYDGVGAIHELPLQGLVSGESTTVTFDWSIMGKAGNHTIYAVADASGAVAEYDESNNTATVDVAVPELVLNVTTASGSYEANQDVGIVATITNLTAGTSYSDAGLTTTIKDPVGAIHELPLQTISTIAPGETSYANSWNTASGMPGSYTISAEISTGGVTPPLQGTAEFEILSTISAYGDMTLSAGEVIQGFPLDISYNITNSGNVDIADGELTIELKGKTNGVTSTLATTALDYLAVLASTTGSLSIEKIDAEPGEYTVSLILKTTPLSSPLGKGGQEEGITIASKDLMVKPPLKVTKGISTLPRVLVWTPLPHPNPLPEGEGVNEGIATDALTNIGAYYKVVHTEDEFKEGMRSGYYNVFALLDTGKPTTDGLTSELTERVYGGDTLVLAGSSNMDDIKMTEVNGTKFTGYLSEGTRTTEIGEPLYEQPVSITASGKFQKVSVTSGSAFIYGTLIDAGGVYPSIIVNEYGNGNGVLATFDLGASAEAANDTDTYSGLLGRLISATAPAEIKIKPEAVAPIEIAVESLGSAFDIRLIERPDSRFTLLDTVLGGTVDSLNSSITWEMHINENEAIRPMYLAALPQFGGTYGAKTEVYYLSNGQYSLYNTYQLDVQLSEGTADIQSRVLNAINLLTVGKSEKGTKDGIIRDYEALISGSSSTRKDIDKDISDLLKIIEELQKLSVDTEEIRAGLDDLLSILERRWTLAK